MNKFRNTICLLLFGILLYSCNNRKPIIKSVEAKRLFAEGFKLLDERLNTSKSDSIKANVLNTKAINKFDSAYRCDTTLIDAATFASECSLYGGEFNKCIYYQNILLHTDTSRRAIADHFLIIGLCYVNSGEIQNAFPYLRNSLTLWKVIEPADSILITDNLMDISNKLFYKKSGNQISNLNSKGIVPCKYSVIILDSIYSINKDRSTLQLINSRSKSCAM
jgi:hypothetical protein